MNVAFIPVRGGSKSIPKKNIKIMAGKPLLFWCMDAACRCKYIEKVYVCTESEEIKQTVERIIDTDELYKKVEVIGRSEESASDTASTEQVMLEFAKTHIFDSITLIQATSPLLQTSELNKGFELFNSPDTDSVISVVHQYRFNWQYCDGGNVRAINYDIYNRPRRQDFEGYLVENGAFYITSRERLISTQNRVSGKIKCVEMDENSYFEVDEEKDWKMIETALLDRKKRTLKDNIPAIKIFLTDVDGCLTDGGMYYSDYGDELKRFNTKDGMGFKMLHEKGILTGIITSEDISLNERRSRKLKLDIYEAGCKNKEEKIAEISEKYGIPLKNICYVGDDINDKNALKSVGFSCCPNDANEMIREMVDYKANAKGGQGVIREVIDLILQENK